MAERTVSVHLKLLNDEYQRPALESVAVTKQLDRNLKDVDKSALDTARDLKVLASEVNAADRKIGELGRDAAKSSTEMGLLNKEANTASGSVSELGRDSVKTAAEVKLLDHELAQARSTLRALIGEFDRTGNRSLLPAIRKQRGDVNLLSSMRKEMEKAAPDAGASVGSLFGGGILRSIVSVFSNPASAALVGAALAALVIEAGALATGGVLGAVGLGAIAAGIAAQFSDPKVKAAAGSLFDWLKAEFVAATADFAAPLAVGFGDLRRDLTPVLGDLRGTFHALAPYVTELEHGLGRAVQQLMPGLNRALVSAGPVLGEIARDLPLLGHAVSVFFDQLSKGAKGGTEALHALVMVIASSIEATGYVLRGLANAFDFMLAASEKILTVLVAIPGVGKAWEYQLKLVQDTRRSFDELGGSAAGAGSNVGGFARSADEARAAVDGLFGSMMTAQQANLAFNQGLNDLRETLKRNKHALDDHTRAGIEDEQAILGLIATAEAQRQKTIETTGDVEAANAEFNRQVGEIRAVGRQMGLTSAQIDALIGKYVALANQPDIVKHVDVIVTTRNRTEGPAAGVFNPTRGMGQIRQFNRYGGLYEHAAAGLLRDSDFYSERPEGRYMIAERGTGGEAFVAKNAPDMRSLAIADVAARWHGGMVVPRYAAPPSGGGGSAGGGGNTYIVNVAAGVAANGAEIGARVVKAIKEYEQSNGAGWRRP